MNFDDHVDYLKEDADRSDQRYDDWSHWTSCEWYGHQYLDQAGDVGSVCRDCEEGRLS